MVERQLSELDCIFGKSNCSNNEACTCLREFIIVRIIVKIIKMRESVVITIRDVIARSDLLTTSRLII